LSILIQELEAFRGFPPYSARNGNVEEQVRFLKAKRLYTVRKMEKINGYTEVCILINASMKFRNKKKYQYDIQGQKEVPAWYTDIYIYCPFRAMSPCICYR
jgi:hypothetical protein